MTGKNKLMILLTLIAGIAIGMFLKGIVFSNPESANKDIEAVRDEHSNHDLPASCRSIPI
jgi:hypothetical protein